MRSEQEYLAAIERTLAKFYRPGDSLRLVRQYPGVKKCGMCGGIVDIRNCFDLENPRSGEVIVCGERCIGRYSEVITKMGLKPVIVCDADLEFWAKRINLRRPGTILIEPEVVSQDDWQLHELIGQREGADDPEVDDFALDGLDPDEIDWDSCDYE